MTWQLILRLEMEDELTELNNQNSIQGPVPKDPKKLDIEEV
jgi:hypothetical protein